MAKEKKRPMDQGGIGNQKNQDTHDSPKNPPSQKKKKINEAI